VLLPLGTAAIVTVALLWDLAMPHLRTALRWLGSMVNAYGRARHAAPPPIDDPGRELRAEQRARALLRSCVNEEEWAMYRDLGFLRVWASARAADGAAHGDAPYAYLLYPHLPLVAYVPQTGALLNEYCVAFPDHGRADDSRAGKGGADEAVRHADGRLPDADDVLAKWMALNADEGQLMAEANMHLPGHQVDPRMVRGDLARLRRWERERLERQGRTVRTAGGSNSVRAA
jgi:hypothetical protein